MTLPVLLIGILIAMGIFSALGWSLVRALQTYGRPRAVHIMHVALIVLGMALISAGWPLPARITGAALIIAALWATMIEQGWSKLLPLFGACFGVSLLLGLPFAGG